MHTQWTNDSQAGFTLIELMVVISITVIVLTLGIPALKTFIDNQKSRAGMSNLHSSLHLARSEAVKRNAQVYVYPNGGADDWDQGWIVTTISGKTYDQCMADLNGCLLIQQPEELTDLDITGGPTQIVFNNGGRSQQTATFVFCDEAASEHVDQRELEIELTGRVDTRINGDCGGGS